VGLFQLLIESVVNSQNCNMSYELCWVKKLSEMVGGVKKVHKHYMTKEVKNNIRCIL
jgi:hypothetical protein